MRPAAWPRMPILAMFPKTTDDPPRVGCQLAAKEWDEL
jgi:hypothetical protein